MNTKFSIPDQNLSAHIWANGITQKEKSYQIETLEQLY